MIWLKVISVQAVAIKSAAPYVDKESASERVGMEEVTPQTPLVSDLIPEDKS